MKNRLVPVSELEVTRVVLANFTTWSATSHAFPVRHFVTLQKGIESQMAETADGHFAVPPEQISNFSEEY